MLTGNNADKDMWKMGQDKKSEKMVQAQRTEPLKREHAFSLFYLALSSPATVFKAMAEGDTCSSAP